MRSGSDCKRPGVKRGPGGKGGKPVAKAASSASLPHAPHAEVERNGRPAPPERGKVAARRTSSRPTFWSSRPSVAATTAAMSRSEEHTSELQSQSNLVCRLLLEKKNKP